jgi:hypothetical protein
LFAVARTISSAKSTPTTSAVGQPAPRKQTERLRARSPRQSLTDRIALMPTRQLLLEGRNRCFDLLDLGGEHLQHLARQIR